MQKPITKETQGKGYLEVTTMIEELEKDLPKKPAPVVERKTAAGKEAILEILGKAADDHKFLARLAENPIKVLEEYDLTVEEKAALATGDLRRIEKWVGKLDGRQSTWIWCRLQQEKW